MLPFLESLHPRWNRPFPIEDYDFIDYPATCCEISHKFNSYTSSPIPDAPEGTRFGTREPGREITMQIHQLRNAIVSLITLCMLAACASHSSPQTSEKNEARPGYAGDPNFKRDPGRRDWKNGYYIDATGRFVPLNGSSPDSLGDGGGAPAVWYKNNGD